MNYKVIALFFSILFLVTFKANAQEQTEETQSNSEKLNNQNEISLVFTDLINGAYQFRYERKLGKRVSVGLGLGYKGEKGILKLSGLDTDKIKTGDITYSGFKIVPEVRYYLSKTQQYGMDGFYMGAYFKHSNFKSDLDGTYTNDEGEDFTIAFDAKFNVTSVGLMVGYKWAISQKFFVDFLIAGPGAGFYGFSLKNTEDLPDEFYDDFNEALDNYSIFDLIDGDFRFKDTNSDTKFTVASFRYGISVGYSF